MEARSPCGPTEKWKRSGGYIAAERRSRRTSSSFSGKAGNDESPITNERYPTFKAFSSSQGVPRCQVISTSDRLGHWSEAVVHGTNGGRCLLGELVIGHFRILCRRHASCRCAPRSAQGSRRLLSVQSPGDAGGVGNAGRGSAQAHPCFAGPFSAADKDAAQCRGSRTDRARGLHG